jgi:glycine cleavage system H lipoate-binding protein
METLQTLGAQAPAPCVWMSAGVISYKLCDRNFDCESCPLDAALRGARPAAVPGAGHLGEARPVSFPGDRLYTAGHAWVADAGGGGTATRRLRFGLDGFAAALLDEPRAVRVLVDGAVRRGEIYCEIETAAGTLPLAAPLDGCVERFNPRLSDGADALRCSPYEDGWLLEISASDADASGDPQSDLHGDEEARQRASFDLRHLRRRAALMLLSDSAEVGPTLPDGGELAMDLPGLLGGRRYLDLLREIVH